MLPRSTKRPAQSFALRQTRPAIFRRWFLHRNSPYVLYVYNPTTNTSGRWNFYSQNSGASTNIGNLLIDDVVPNDGDGDGLNDDAEMAVGTDPQKADTNGDGLSDLADIQAGIDPLFGVGLPTGLVAGVNLAGAAEAIAISAAADGSTQSTAFVADTTGLAIVDVGRADKPVIRSQLSLSGGSATDVAVDSSLQIVAVADNAGGLVLVNVANTSNPIICKDHRRKCHPCAHPQRHCLPCRW